jgi:hypothetical protein
MPIEREEAARALRDAKAANRSTTAVGYGRASQHLILWGIVWAVCNIAGVLRAPHGTYLFPALMLIGVAGSIVVGLRSAGGGRLDHAWRSATVAAAVSLFLIGMQVVMPTNSLITAEAMILLAVGTVYMVMGVSLGWRLSAVGAALMVSIIVGWIYAREQFFLWLAFAGGGGLVLGGLWLRKA